MKKILMLVLMSLSFGTLADEISGGVGSPIPGFPLFTCWAHSPLLGEGGNEYMAGTPDSVKLVVTKSGRVNASCHIEDTSGIYEDKAEQIKIDSCEIALPDGGIVTGTGHATAAANNKEAGGNLTVVCHAKIEE